MKALTRKLTVRTLIVAGALMVGAPAVGLVLAQYGLISPPELRSTVLPPAVEGTQFAPSVAHVAENWEALEDGEKAEALAAAVIAAVVPATRTERTWKYYVLRRSTGFSSSTTVLASEQVRSSSGRARESDVDRWALWIEIERLSQNDAFGKVMRSREGSHTKEPVATFRAVLKEGKWDVDPQDTQR